VFKRSGDLGCRTRRQSAAHAVSGTSRVTPRKTPRMGRNAIFKTKPPRLWTETVSITSERTATAVKHYRR
jgi:hypothetical protein